MYIAAHTRPMDSGLQVLLVRPMLALENRLHWIIVYLEEVSASQIG
jgi:hypothetical protein